MATAKKRQFTHFCLTEHMPRYKDTFLYPEEIEKKYTSTDLLNIFDKYMDHALALQKTVNSQDGFKILVGFEVEGLDELHIEQAKQYLPKSNMCVGSVHYVNSIPIDFDAALWLKARESYGGSARALYKAYFELQHKVLALKPDVVGHFDLIRLFDPETHNLQEWPEVWDQIIRNIDLVVSYGGLFELNSAAIRKGWNCPYPQSDIAKTIIERGGKFCLSDDSHAYAQVGLNYHKVWEYVTEVLQLESIYYLDLGEKNNTVVRSLPVEEVSQSKFWDQYK